VSREPAPKQAEGALADASARLDAALQAGAIFTWNWDIWNWDIQNNRLSADPNLTSLFNLPSTNAEGGSLDKYLQSVHPEDLPKVTSALDRAVTTGEPYDGHAQLRRRVATGARQRGQT
jgi:PAS domain-containing protein